MSLPKKIEQRASKEGNNVILITGSNGYVGGYVLRTLAQSGPAQHVKGLVRSEAQADKIRRYGALPAIGDVTDPASLTRAMAGVDVVIHLAAVNRDRGASTMARINAEGTRNVVNAAKAAGVTRIINLVGLGADESRPYPLASPQRHGVRAATSTSGTQVSRRGTHAHAAHLARDSRPASPAPKRRPPPGPGSRSATP